MNKHLIGAATALLAFMLGLASGSARMLLRQTANEQATPNNERVVTPTPTATPENLSESDAKLIDDNPFHAKLNGWTLPLGAESSSEYDIEGAKVIPLSSGGLLAGAGSTLVRLNSKRRVVWKYDVSQWLIDFDVVESTGFVYGTAADNIMFIVDLASGKELHMVSRNGSAAYGQVQAYGKDECLVIDNFWGYRERLRQPDIEDGIDAWRGTQFLWHLEFPPDAELVVKGKRIFAITKTKTSIYVKEIFPPTR